MALIKNMQAEPMSRDAIVLDLGDLSAQAEAIVQRARQDAERIRKEAEAERERLLSDAADIGRAQGHAEGREQGVKEGLEEGRREAIASMQEQLARLDERWSAAVEGFESERDQLLADSRTDVVRLAITIAERVTRKRIECDVKAVEPQVEAALQCVLEPTQLAVLVHPDDVDIANEALPRLLARMSSSPHIGVRPDASLTRGDCIVETRCGEVDARIDTQLERIISMLAPEQEPSSETAPDIDS